MSIPGALDSDSVGPGTWVCIFFKAPQQSQCMARVDIHWRGGGQDLEGTVTFPVLPL